MRLGDHFFSGAAFAGNQHGGARRRNLSDQVEHGEHLLALADDVGEIVALLERALELNVFFPQPPAFDGHGNLRDQFVIRPRLSDVVLRAAFERRARHVDRAVRGDQNDRQVRIAAANLAQQFEAVAVRAGSRRAASDRRDDLRVFADPTSPVSASVTVETLRRQQRFQSFANFQLRRQQQVWIL